MVLLSGPLGQEERCDVVNSGNGSGGLLTLVLPWSVGMSWAVESVEKDPRVSRTPQRLVGKQDRTARCPGPRRI